MFAEKSDNDIRVMTYDSLVSQCESVHYDGEKIILSTWKEQGFKIKKLPKQEISTSVVSSCQIYFSVITLKKKAVITHGKNRFK